jgi:hypothetical protein
MTRLGRLPVAFGLLVLFLAIYFSMDLTFLFALRGIKAAFVAPECDKWHRGVLTIGLGVLGILRVVRFHPVLNSAYTRWLQKTPWTSDMPLPLGPVHLVWTDGVVLVGAMLLARYSTNASTLVPLIAYAIGYLVAGALTMIGTEQPLAVIIPFGLGGVVRLWDYTGFVLAICAGMYGVFALNLRSSLAKCSFVGLSPKLKFPSGNLGWPFDALRPKTTDIKMPWITIVIGAALIGWLAYAIDVRVRLADPSDRSSANPFIIFAGLALALSRMMVYMLGYGSPRPLWARILTGRLIAPSYDYVFLTSIATGAATVFFVILSPSPMSIYEPVHLGGTLAALVIIAVGGRPSLERWRLTGGHRITPRVAKQQGNRQNRKYLESVSNAGQSTN